MLWGRSVFVSRVRWTVLQGRAGELPQQCLYPEGFSLLLVYSVKIPVGMKISSYTIISINKGDITIVCLLVKENVYEHLCVSLPFSLGFQAVNLVE